MKIAAIEAYEYGAAWVHGAYGMSHGRLEQTQRSLVVRVITDEGLEGWAETCPHGRTYLPSFVEGEQAALRVLAPAVLGLDPRNVGRVNAAMDDTLLGSNAAKGVIDMACWDVLGQAAGLPICDLLGGRMQDDVPLFVPIPIGTEEATVAHVERELAAGIRILQVKVGDDPATDAARVRLVLEIAGPECTLVADANGGWNLQSALLAARALDGLPVFLEQPCRSMGDCAELRKHTDLPMVLDESIVTMDDLIHAKFTVGAGGVNLKPGRIGGFTRTRALRDTAQALGMTVTIDDTWGGGLTTAQNMHLAASTQAQNFTAVASFAEWVQPVVAEGLVVGRSGRGAASTTPGLGVAVRRELLGEAWLAV